MAPLASYHDLVRAYKTLSAMDLAERGHTPPPREMSLRE